MRCRSVAFSGCFFQLQGIRVGGQPTHARQRVIDVAVSIVVLQRLVAGQGGGNADLLRSPVEVDADCVGREHHEGPHAGVRVEQALGVGVAARGGAERKQRRAIATVSPDRQLGPHDEAEAVAQRVKPLDARHVVHELEGIAGDVELAAGEARPCGDAAARKVSLEAGMAPLALDGVDRVIIAVARIESAQQLDDYGGLVLLNQMPQRQVYRHAARLDQRDRLGAVVRPVQNALGVRRR
jgi:hypothetical protein